MSGRTHENFPVETKMLHLAEIYCRTGQLCRLMLFGFFRLHISVVKETLKLPGVLVPKRTVNIVDKVTAITTARDCGRCPLLSPIVLCYETSQQRCPLEKKNFLPKATRLVMVNLRKQCLLGRVHESFIVGRERRCSRRWSATIELQGTDRCRRLDM